MNLELLSHDVGTSAAALACLSCEQNYLSNDISTLTYELRFVAYDFASSAHEGGKVFPR